MNRSIIILTILVLGLAGFVVWQQLSKPKFGYILISEVYNGFELKKDLEKKFQATSNARQRILDSLEMDLQLLARNIENFKGKNDTMIMLFQRKREEFIQQQQKTGDDNTAMGSQYDKEILTQLNQYVKEFGTKNGYTYIFGNDGNGSLMHASEGENITKEVIEYINSKYNNK